MNHCVPGFHEMLEDCSIPESSGFSRPRKLVTGEDEIMELLWQNGPVVVQRSSKKSPFVGAGGGGEVEIPAEQMTVRGIRPSQEEQHLFMQEDEMASWLQYPIDDSSFDRDLYSDLLYSTPPPPPPPTITTIAPPRTVAEIRPQPTPAPPRPPIPPPAQKPNNSSRFQNFVHFSRHPSRPRIEPISKPSVTATRESTEVESNETPLFGSESRVSHTLKDCRTQTNTESITPTLGNTGAATGEMAAGTCELTMTSSPGGSGSSFSAIVKPRGPRHKPTPPAVATEDRKRKGREEADINECQSEEMEFEAAEPIRQARGSASIKRSRAAEVHNLSERRRRDRINEKMRALQELVPRCNKSDKASMLDEAIEYLKSLQMQVQMMMSMGCGMVPMMYPGMQQYMPAMGRGLGLGMGMGMGMDMAMNRPMMPYPTIIPGSGMPNQAAAQMNPRFHMPVFHLAPVPVPDPSRIQVSNQPDPMLNSLVVHNPNQPQMPNFIDPYQQFPGLRQAQLPLPQNRAAVQLSACKDFGNPENQKSG